MTVPVSPRVMDVLRPPAFVVGDISEEWEHGEYDVLLTTLGFETRSSFILERLASRSSFEIVSAYNTRRTHAHSDNLQLALALGCEPIVESDREYVVALRSRVDEVCSRVGRPLSVAVDISSSSRVRLAAIVSCMLDLPAGTTVDFFYVPGVFRSPQPERRSLAFHGPVMDRFVGRSGPSDWPLTAIIGLGFEGIEALGAFQILESKDVYLLIPEDESQEYAEVVRNENRSLTRIVGKEQCLSYNVFEPALIYETLERVVYGALWGSRPVLVPLGPKIFALSALLASARFNREVPVWRFSAEQYGPSEDVTPSGLVHGLRVSLGPQQ